jgi:hypothetical protein
MHTSKYEEDSREEEVGKDQTPKEKILRRKSFTKLPENDQYVCNTSQKPSTREFNEDDKDAD